ncbi:MAG: CHAT domain-containing protein [Planctomycetota bacterium]|jgi:tetratricopeptide (TPR) repeat protein
MDVHQAATRLDALARGQYGDADDRAPTTEELVALIDAVGRLSMADAPAAIRATEDAIDVAHRMGLTRAGLQAQRAHVRALAYAGRYDEALAVCTAAQEDASRANAPIERGRLRLASMHPLAELGRLTEAIAAGCRAIDDFRAAGDDALGARAEINIGVIHQRSDAPREAVACFDRARPLVEDDAVTLGHLENNRGEALLALDRIDDARAAFRSARDAFDQAGAALTAGIAVGNLADVDVRGGHLGSALESFEQARQRLHAAGSPVHVARVIAEQADAKALLGLTRDAIVDFRAAIAELDEHGLVLEAARARAGLGTALIRLGRLSDAETALAAAAHGFDGLGHVTAKARVELMRSVILAERGALDDARALALGTLGPFSDRPIDAARARWQLGRIALQAGAVESAEAEFTLGCELIATLDLAPLASELHHARGLARRARGRTAEAVNDLRTAVRALERVRGTLQADRFRSAFLGDRASVYEDLVVARLDEGGPGAVSEALELVELAKSRTLLEQVLSSGIAPEACPDDELAARHASLHASLNALYSRANDDRFTARPATDWRRSVATVEQELRQVEQRIDSTRGVASLFAHPGGAASLREALGTREVLVEYFAEGETLSAFVVCHDTIVAFRDLAPLAEIESLIETLRFQIGRGLRADTASAERRGRLLDDCRTVLRELDKRLLAPLRDAIGLPETLIVAPHGPLHMLPFHALHDGQCWLIEQMVVAYTPSTGVLRAIRARPDLASPGERSIVAGVGDDIARQPAVEATHVARILGDTQTNVLVDADATVDAFLRAAGDAHVVHLACHAHFDPAHPAEGGLQLADRMLTLRDLYDLRTRARLVTLSACETGLSHVDRGDELVGLVRAFLAAGAGNVAATLWPVDDVRTSTFMQHLYAAWPSIRAGDSSPHAALRSVQLETLARDPHPAHWAPYFLAGGCR